MNIRQLKQFVAIARSGNISRSAKDQNISQPALTRSIKNLEEDLGVDLIERRSNGVFLNAYGEHLLEYARSIVNDSERVRREIRAMQAGVRGKLAIGVGPAFSSGVLPTALETLLGRTSQLEVRLQEGFVEDLCAELRNGMLDVVLSLFPANFDHTDLSFVRLCEVESVLVAHKSHRLAGKKQVLRSELARANWVIADQKYAFAAFHEYLQRTDVPQTAQHIRASSTRLIKSLVKESDYLTILPKILIENELKSGELVVIDGPAKPIVSVGGILCRSTGFKAAPVREFTQIVEEQFDCVGDGTSGLKNISIRKLF